MESSESETDFQSYPSIIDDCLASADKTFSKDADEKSTYSNTQSLDSGVSTSSEISSCEDCNIEQLTDKESKAQCQPPVSFFQTLLPWIQKPKTSQIRNPIKKNIDKIGGTLALIQYSRPSNLPMKSAAEDRKHKKQYNAILEEARKREVREERARKNYREEQLKKEEKLAASSVIWSIDILPNFESLRNSKKVRELWWSGLPPNIRGKVWKLGIGNDLNISSKQYDIFVEKIINEVINEDETMIAIKLDVSRTFSNLAVFQEDGPLYKTLQTLLAAFTIYREDIGYVQGMSFVGAILTLNMEANDAFICFANLLDKPCHKAAFTLNQKQMNVYYRVFSNALALKIPKIHLHFCAIGLSPDLYLLDWLYTIYAKAMPLDIVCRIWDVFIRDGDEFLFRTALGILYMYQNELLRMDFIKCSQFLRKLPDKLDAPLLFDNIAKMNTSIGMQTFHDMISQLS